MNELARDIAAIIAHEGPISLERYMSLCLSHPAHGYYMTRDPLGADGDFVTSPEISQMFGELLGLWAAETWSMCGAPQPARLVELGPGRGTLMSDALRAARVARDFYATLEVTMVETSPVLAERQRDELAMATRPVAWVETIEEAPDQPAIYLANEFFDALPVRHYVNTPRGWCERQVGLAEDRFILGAAPEPEPYLRPQAPLGAIIEVAAVSQRIMTAIAARIVRKGGAALIIDYGHTETTLGETWQAMRDHSYVDPLESPGEADLTAHVDFAALARAARAAGAQVHGPVTQSHFLRQIGIERRAQALMRNASEEQAGAVAAGLMRLISEEKETDMGRLFKAIAITRPDVGTLPGFHTEEVA
jgi:NADH dehydrogenase [ubiquinone] 1 alpha subcomplex assembly factor 7